MDLYRAVGLALGFAADRAFGDPARHHPVALFGSLAAAVEQRTWRDSVVAGALHSSALVAGVAVLACAGERLPGPLRCLATAAACWTVVGGRSLGAEALFVDELLGRGDLPGARQRLTHLVGRNTESLSEAEVARAVVESVAENSSDAVVAPLFWGATCGVPGLLGYRAVNTLDAMIGHRSPRYERFGKFAARLDDIANWLPARLSGVFVAAVLPRQAGEVARVCRRDARAHPSPNAGVVESAFAGALGLRLGGVNDYAGRSEHRAEMGDGRAPVPADIKRAVRLSSHVGLAAAATALVAQALRSGRAGRA